MVKHTSPFNTFFPSASAAKGVIAVEKPIPKHCYKKQSYFQEKRPHLLVPFTHHNIIYEQWYDQAFPQL
jgi:hypothetical protein